MIGTPETLLATYMDVPTGGVNKPIVRLITIMIPNCTISTPKLWATGANIGANNIMAGPLSKNIPTINNSRLIIRSNKMGLSVMPNRKAVIFCGICSLDNNHPNKDVEAMIVDMTAVLSAAS